MEFESVPGHCPFTLFLAFLYDLVVSSMFMTIQERVFVGLRFCRQVNTIKIMLSQSVNVFLDSLRCPKLLSSTKHRGQSSLTKSEDLQATKHLAMQDMARVGEFLKPSLVLHFKMYG